MIRFTALLITSLVAAPVLAQSQAERMATITGELIGGSTTCGVSSDRLTRIGAEVSGAARDAATSPAEAERARVAYESAASRMAEAVKIEFGQACTAAQTALDGLERACVPGNVATCRAGIQALR